MVSGVVQKRGPSVSLIALPAVLGDDLRLSPSTVGSDLPVGFRNGWKRGKSVSPIALPTILGDARLFCQDPQALTFKEPVKRHS